MLVNNALIRNKTLNRISAGKKEIYQHLCSAMSRNILGKAQTGRKVKSFPFFSMMAF